MSERKLKYTILAYLWRGAHAKPEEVDLVVWTAEAPWSEPWIDKVRERIWKVTMYDSKSILASLTGIRILDIGKVTSQEIIQEQPTVDVRSCDGCRYEQFGNHRCYSCARNFADRYLRDDDWFCADGERKDDETD